MKIITYLPKTDKGIQELQKSVTEVHIKATMNNINKLTCPKEEKIIFLEKSIELLKGMQNS